MSRGGQGSQEAWGRTYVTKLTSSVGRLVAVLEGTAANNLVFGVYDIGAS